MAKQKLPPAAYSYAFDLAALGESGADILLAPTEAERAAIACWLGVESLARFEARVHLKRQSAESYHYDAEADIDLTQACVVTLEPVRAHHALQVARRYLVLRPPPRSRGTRAPAGAPQEEGDDEGPELIARTEIDLAQPILEDLVLALDPYPRAPGAAFKREEDDERRAAEDSPFAVLKKLKGER